jgi:hypothetical protein
MVRRPFAAPVLLAVASVLAVLPARSEPSLRDQLITHYCSQAMAADFAKAGKTPPAGMVAFTCGCVLQQVDAQVSIDQAKTVCKQKAIQKYGAL